jgi:PAS domain-containing protein
VWVSEQIQALVGCTCAEWASGYDVWSQRIHPEDRGRVLATNEQFLRTGGPESDEYRIVLPDGRVRWIHERVLLIRAGPDQEPLVHGSSSTSPTSARRTRSPPAPAGCSGRSSSMPARRSPS